MKTIKLFSVTYKVSERKVIYKTIGLTGKHPLSKGVFCKISFRHSKL